MCVYIYILKVQYVSGSNIYNYRRTDDLSKVEDEISSDVQNGQRFCDVILRKVAGWAHAFCSAFSTSCLPMDGW